jgi:hypothetical protein
MRTRASDEEIDLIQNPMVRLPSDRLGLLPSATALARIPVIRRRFGNAKLVTQRPDPR